MSGAFITFEGLDGCGKSTQMEKLPAALRAAGHDVVTTREPGGTAIGERIRELLLDSRTLGLDARVVLIEAQRKIEVVHREVLEALEKLLKMKISQEAHS